MLSVCWGGGGERGRHGLADWNETLETSSRSFSLFETSVFSQSGRTGESGVLSSHRLPDRSHPTRTREGLRAARNFVYTSPTLQPHSSEFPMIFARFISSSFNYDAKTKPGTYSLRTACRPASAKAFPNIREPVKTTFATIRGRDCVVKSGEDGFQ